MDENGNCTFSDAFGFREPALYLVPDGLGLDRLLVLLACQGRGSITSLISETGGGGALGLFYYQANPRFQDMINMSFVLKIPIFTCILISGGNDGNDPD